MSCDFYLWVSGVLKVSNAKLHKEEENIGDLLKEYNNNNIIMTKENYMSIVHRIRDIKLKQFLMDNIYNEEIISSFKKTMNRYSVSYITYDDSLYPDILKEIYDPPHVIYYRGDISLLNENNIISVIGSRKCTSYGKNATKHFVSQLSRRGFVIASGMANGIDSQAHINCIENGGKTIAVMGTSMEKTYPQNALKLKEDIVEKGGLVISEQPINTPTQRYFFSMRNRIIAAICSALIVVEACTSSGTSITVDCALDYGKSVYAIPGSIFSDNSKGCNKMITQGAKPLSDLEDILEDFPEYNVYFQKNLNEVLKNSGNLSTNCVNINFDEINKVNNLDFTDKNIIKILKSEGAQDLDTLAIKTGLAITDLMFSINKLMLAYIIVEEGINKYALNILK